MPDTNKNEKEFQTFGFEGKLRTGFVTGMYGLLIAAIVYMGQEIRRVNGKLEDCNNDKVEIQASLYEMMLPEIKKEVKKEVTDQVTPIAESVDTTTNNIKDFIKRVEK